MDIAQALKEAADLAGWSVTKIAAEAGVGEGTARYWITGEREPRGSQLMTLRRALPGFAKLLDSNTVAI